MFSVMRVFEPEVHNVVQLCTNPLPTLFQLHHRHRSCQKTPQTAMVDNHLILSHQSYQSILVICYNKSKLKLLRCFYTFIFHCAKNPADWIERSTAVYRCPTADSADQNKNHEEEGSAYRAQGQDCAALKVPTSSVCSTLPEPDPD